MKRPSKCTLCGRDDVGVIDRAIRAGRSLTAIGETFGVSKSTVHRHAEHTKGQAVAKVAGASTEVASPPAVLPSGLPRLDSAEDMIRELSISVRAQIVRLVSDGDLSVWERAKLQSSAVQALSLLTKLDGSTELNEARIMRMPAYRRVADATFRTLAPWPDALKAVCDALSALAEGDR